jgi:hypothetical protein
MTRGKKADGGGDPEPTSKLCFVIGPIGPKGSETRKKADMLLNAIIKPVLEADPFNYEVVRADQIDDPGMIGDQVILKVRDADLCIADLSELNPNVFYELGIRHAREKPVIHVAEANTVVPFDNAGHRAEFFDLSDWHSHESLKTALRKFIERIESPDYKVSNPLTQANASFQMADSADPRERVLYELESRISDIERAQHDFETILEENMQRLPAFHTKKMPRLVKEVVPGVDRNLYDRIALILNRSSIDQKYKVLINKKIFRDPFFSSNIMKDIIQLHKESSSEEEFEKSLIGYLDDIDNFYGPL